MDFRQWIRFRDWAILATLLSVSSLVMMTENQSIVRALRGAALEATGNIESSMSWIGRYFRALDENDLLRNRNIRLSSELARSRESDIENLQLRRMLGFIDTVSYDVLPARIIEKDVTDQKNYLTLNVGRLHGVSEEMGVLDEEGILGKVIQVSENYALVMSYLNTDFRVPAKIQPSQAQGIVRWEGVVRNELLLEHVIKTERVADGQIAVTSGYSSIFPPGYPIGRVKSVVPLPGKNQLRIQIIPLSQIDTVEHAFVVLEKPDPDRESLQTKE